MAATKKKRTSSTTSKQKQKTTSKKKTAAKGNAAKRKQKAKEAYSSFSEYMVIAAFFVCLFMFLTFFGIGGSIGSSLADFLRDIFGLIAILIPFVLFFVIWFLSANSSDFRAYRRVVALLLSLLFLCTMIQVIMNDGGSLGGILYHSLSPKIGNVGTFLLSLLGLVLSFVLFTGTSVVGAVQKSAGTASERSRQQKELRKQDRISRLEAREEENRKNVNKKRGRTGTDRILTSDSYRDSGELFTLSENIKKPDKKEIFAESDKDFNSFDRKVKKAPTLKPDLNPTTRSEEHAYEEPTIIGAATDIVSIPENDTQETATKSKESRPKRKTKSSASKQSAETSENKSSDTFIPETEAEQEYQFPPIHLLNKGTGGGGDSESSLKANAAMLEEVLGIFGVNARVTNVTCGPSVTRYELEPEMGVKVSKIVGLADDIQYNLAVPSIRIEAPIPGKKAVGIEVPNQKSSAVSFRDLIESKKFIDHKSKIAFAVGKDIAGEPIISDIAKMPHLLIAGATGSGKSVCINTLIMSILYKATPKEVRLIMIDPKVVELSVYNGIPHLLAPVVTDPKQAAGALQWAVAEMTRRYQAFASMQVRDMKTYNQKVDSLLKMGEDLSDENGQKRTCMPQIVIIVDELADLMMVASKEVEEAICRLAQLARAAGIHLILATQRPSVNVVTGLIKANMPSRIAFAVSSGIDSRTILDQVGAEKLLGKGDMLYYPASEPKPKRLQGSFVSDEEIQAVVEFLKENALKDRSDETSDNVQFNTVVSGDGSKTILNASSSDEASAKDAYFADCGKLIIEKDKASIGMLQRAFKIGFNRAARIMDELCEAGVVGGEEGTKPRKILMTMEEFEDYLQNN